MTRIGYARVSTPDQEAGLAAQVSMLEEAGCEFVFRDIASGRLSSRPQWDAARAVLKAGDALVAVRLDRFSRSVSDLLAVAEDFRVRGVDLVCTAQPIDTTTAAGKLFFTLIAAFAEFERNLISERTKDGLAATSGRGRNGVPFMVVAVQNGPAAIWVRERQPWEVDQDIVAALLETVQGGGQPS